MSSPESSQVKKKISSPNFKKRDSKWDAIKRKGSKHYKSGKTEPIDLYRSGDLMWGKCITDIIKYAYRNRVPFSMDQIERDMNKIIHYAEIAKVIAKEEIDKQIALAKERFPMVAALPCKECERRKQQDQINELIKKEPRRGGKDDTPNSTT